MSGLKEINIDEFDIEEVASHNNFSKNLKPLEIKELDLKAITPDPFQPRKTFAKEKLQELSESIKEHGLMQPISVIEIRDNTYQILAGERRYRAHLLAKLETIKALVYVIPPETNPLIKQIIENTQRDDLTVFEEAKSYKTLWDSNEFKSKKELAKAVSKKETYLSKMFSILTLDEEVLNHLVENNPKIGLEVLSELAKIEDKTTQKEFYYDYIAGKITRQNIRNEKKGVVIGEGGEIIHQGQTTIKDILGEDEATPDEVAEVKEASTIKEVAEVIIFDENTKTVLECNGFGVQNQFGTFISLSGDLKGAINIEEMREKIESSNNFNYKITIERIPVKK
jgi:ParB family transcriptional regulator, chromosome partitioning protein